MIADGILFDLDGTLWDSVDEVILTWNRVFMRHPGLRKPIDRAEQESLMGLQMDEIAAKLFPNETRIRQAALMDECVQEENSYLLAHGATLYPAVKETLRQLHLTYRLFIVSNCQSGYIEAFLAAHQLQDLFDGFLCFGDTGCSKGENIRSIIKKHDLKAPVYVGDTQGDLDSATYAGVRFIYASYGFGSVARYDDQISDLPDLLRTFG